MQPVVAQQELPRCARVAEVAHERSWLVEAGAACVERHDERAILDREAAGVGPACARQRHRGVEEGADPGDRRGAAGRVVAVAARPALGFGNRVGAVEGVVERAPAGFGGVGGVARVGYRNDQLRPGYPGDLRIDVRGLDGEVRAFVHQIADLPEVAVGADVGGQAFGAVPVVDAFLQPVTRGEQRAVARGEVAQDVREGLPEIRRLDPVARERLDFDELRQLVRDLQAGPCHSVHPQSPTSRCHQESDAASPRQRFHRAAPAIVQLRDVTARRGIDGFARRW